VLSLTDLAIPRLSRQLIQRILTSAAAAGALTELTSWKLSRLHGGLLYPDGYQYLLMSRGIARNGRAILNTGHGGNVLLPNADAALKPFEPLLVALLHFTGFGWWDAARVVTAASGVGVIVLAAALTWQLTRSNVLAGCAAALCIASPSITWWSGFLGPDALAPCLGLAALLAGLRGRPRLAGVLAGLAATSRPEYALAALVVLIGTLLDRDTRHAALRAAAFALLTVAFVVAVTRPPFGGLDGRQLLAAACAVAIAGIAWFMLTRLALHGAIAVAATAAGIGAVAMAVLDGRAEGLRMIVAQQPSIVALIATGLVAAASGKKSVEALRLMLLIGLMLLVYLEKNPTLDRYPTQLLPLAIPLALAGLSQLRFRAAVGLAAALIAVATLVSSPTPPTIKTDTFRTVASELAPTGPALISATPDAYSFWLPNRPQRLITAGTHGLFIVDGATRSLTPLHVCGKVTRRVSSGLGFTSLDGNTDIAPAELVVGSARSRCS
jgi:hypothetical protein